MTRRRDYYPTGMGAARRTRKRITMTTFPPSPTRRRESKRSAATQARMPHTILSIPRVAAAAVTRTGGPRRNTSTRRESAGRRSAGRRSAGRGSAVRRSVGRRSAGRRSAGRRSAGRRSAGRRSAVRRSAVRGSAMRRSVGVTNIRARRAIEIGRRERSALP